MTCINMVTQDMYREEIMEHYRNPQNFGKLKQSSFAVEKINDLCGDEIKLEILLDGEKKIEKIGFTGSGCAISIASASIFTEYLKGKLLSEIEKIKPEQVIQLLNIPISPARRKCALLAYDAIKEKLN